MSELLRGTEQHQRRVLVGTGAVIVAVAMLAILVAGLLPDRRPPGTMEIVVMTPTVGQGIDTQSNVVLHGISVGTIVGVARHGEAAELRLRLDSNSVRGLTDSFDFDFRPANAWGLSALNLLPREVGKPLADGARVNRAPAINATLSQLMSSQMTFIDSVLTEKLAQLIRNTGDYTTAMVPFIESGLMLGNLVAETQRDTSIALLRDVNNLMTPIPAVIDTMLTSVHNFRNQKGRELLTADMSPVHETLAVIAPEAIRVLFQVAGDHQRELTAATEVARAQLDGFATIVQRSRSSLRLDKLLAGLQAGYFGAYDEESHFRLVLEPLPAIESAMPPNWPPNVPKLLNSDGVGGR